MEEVHLGCTDLMNAEAPVTCGQAIDVPDFMAYSGCGGGGFLPIKAFTSSTFGTTAPKMATPGAIISGCRRNLKAL